MDFFDDYWKPLLGMAIPILYFLGYLASAFKKGVEKGEKRRAGGSTLSPVEPPAAPRPPATRPIQRTARPPTPPAPPTPMRIEERQQVPTLIHRITGVAPGESPARHPTRPSAHPQPQPAVTARPSRRVPTERPPSRTQPRRESIAIEAPIELLDETFSVTAPARHEAKLPATTGDDARRKSLALRRLLRGRQNLRQAFLLSEVLREPLALRHTDS